MLIKITDPFPVYSSEITPEALYAGRRRFLKQLGLVAGASIGGLGSVAAVVDTGAQLPSLNVARKSEMAGGESLTPYEAITHYNNYYEFGTEKDDPARNAGRLRTRPWSVVVDGECEAPGRIDLDDLIKPQVLEERIYRHRCVEGWSMVAPWVGFPLADVLKRFRPTSKAMGSIHYLWLVKADTREPLIYLSILLGLLAFRPQW
jgi:sulfoxide reductase catalytic subunit YedY